MTVETRIEETVAQKILTGIALSSADGVRAVVRDEVVAPSQNIINSVMMAIGMEMRKQGLPGFHGEDNKAWRTAVTTLVQETMVNDALRKIAVELTK